MCSWVQAQVQVFLAVLSGVCSLDESLISLEMSTHWQAIGNGMEMEKETVHYLSSCDKKKSFWYLANCEENLKFLWE